MQSNLEFHHLDRPALVLPFSGQCAESRAARKRAASPRPVCALWKARRDAVRGGAYEAIAWLALLCSSLAGLLLSFSL
jgi:hypothetical protein